MHGKRILLGVTGGIAAYKSADLVRRLIERGSQVQVVMTAAAREFVTPMTFQALSGRAVRTDLWDSAHEAAMGHIELARWADLVLVAPASADFMARLAHGLADDLLSTLCLATAAPIALVPAMNQQMWRNAATQSNAQLLRARGLRLLGPGHGDQACGEHGPGRMLEPLEIIAQLEATAGWGGALKGQRVLLTAGPTRECLDPVRFVSNRSSGKMGFAMAEAMCEQGADVVLISGPVALSTPCGVRRIDVESCEQMYQAVERELPGTAIFIGTAAVADYRPTVCAEHKIKKSSENMTLELVRNPDILAQVSASAQRPFVVGFAAETNGLEQHARTKLLAKNLDLIAANEVGHSKAFDCEDNSLLVLWRGGRIELPSASKRELARSLTALIIERFAEQQAAQGADEARELPREGARA
jgi:phosphopantothenoylcysteine decarboxylase/phosphopantothenate--cysteine ligase